MYNSSRSFAFLPMFVIQRIDNMHSNRQQLLFHYGFNLIEILNIFSYLMTVYISSFKNICLGASTIVYQAKPLPAVRHPMWVPVRVSSSLLMNLENHGTWPMSCTLHTGDPHQVPSSWLWIGPAPTMATIWGMNQHTEDFACLSSSLHNSTFPTKILNL